MLFIDTIVMLEQNRTLSIIVYKRPTHTDKCLYCDSHHHTAVQYRVINVLVPMAMAVCSTQELLRTEQQHLREILIKYKYPT